MQCKMNCVFSLLALSDFFKPSMNCDELIYFF